MQSSLGLLQSLLLFWATLETRIQVIWQMGWSNILKGLHLWLRGKESPCNAGDRDSIPASGRSPGGENGNPLQYSCLRNPTDRGAWRLQSMGLQRIRHDAETKTKQQQTLLSEEYYTYEIQRGAIDMCLLLGSRCNNLFFNL